MSNFQITYRNKDIWKVRTNRSGFSWSQELTWLLAAQWWGCNPEEFGELDTDNQGIMVAAYMAHQQIEAVSAAKQQEKLDGRGTPVQGSRAERNSRRGD